MFGSLLAANCDDHSDGRAQLRRTERDDDIRDTSDGDEMAAEAAKSFSETQRKHTATAESVNAIFYSLHFSRLTPVSGVRSRRRCSESLFSRLDGRRERDDVRLILITH